ncbi:MAG: hypothetical protein ACKV2O_11355, partial [Acidimicrobiales bacterium]
MGIGVGVGGCRDQILNWRITGISHGAASSVDNYSLGVPLYTSCCTRNPLGGRTPQNRKKPIHGQ